jgi:hypothetical protein
MGAFNGKDGEFILKNAVENVRIELLAGNISKQKAYAIAKGAPNNEAVQNVALVKSKNMTADELKIFAEILVTRFTQKQEP